MPRAQLRLPPQTRMRGPGTLPVEKPVRLAVPHHPPVLRLDHSGPERREEPPIGVLEVGDVVERQLITRAECHTTSLGRGMTRGMWCGPFGAGGNADEAAPVVPGADIWFP